MVRIFLRAAGFLFIVILGTLSSSAQTLTPQRQKVCAAYQENLRCQELVNEFFTLQLLLKGQTPTLDNPPGDTVAFASRITSKAITKQAQVALQTVAISAANTQIGGAPTASGSTNLVSKPTTTDFISIASESGAFTDTINGTTMTIQANALGLTKYFTNQPVFQRWRSKYADTIQPLSFTTTLNVAQTGSATATTAGSANSSTPTSIASVLLPTNNASFSSFGVNYSLYRPYSPQDKNFLDNWNKAVGDNQAAIDAASKTIATTVFNLFKDVTDDVSSKTEQARNTWHQAAMEAEQSGGEQAFEAFVKAYSVYDNAYEDLILASSPNASKNVLALVQALDAFNQTVYTVLDKARGTPLATLSYLYSAPQDKPATHSFTAVLSYLFKGDDPKKRTPLMGAQLTANFTTSIYASVPAGAKYGRLRDFQLSGEFDKPFGGTPDEPRGTWSLAGYGQYQYDPTVLNITAGNLVPGTNIPLPGDAQVLLGTAGWLGVAQGKLTINLKKGLSIPVAVKWSNKTDLLKGDDVRGQVGLSYDLSALSKLISPGK